MKMRRGGGEGSTERGGGTRRGAEPKDVGGTSTAPSNVQAKIDAKLEEMVACCSRANAGCSMACKCVVVQRDARERERERERERDRQTDRERQTDGETDGGRGGSCEELVDFVPGATHSR
jgi:hypothetical protein